MTPPARTLEQRKHDTLDRLEREVDAWVATAGDDGVPCMVPLSFLWDGHTLLIATASANPTARNLLANGRVRLGLGLTRDVVLIEGTAEATAAADIPASAGDAFAAKAGFEPRGLTGSYHYFTVSPLWMQAWREVNELEGRDLMREGKWLV
jgi:nitroimidazol reductase NimA-like FMN-containing flavoprotein (pyridoxamine 5'-phosphate oxidase superfamily)